MLLLVAMTACARPKPGLGEFSEQPELYKEAVRFYEFIKYKELDVFMEQEELKDYFPDRKAYYSFLDTILPPMRDRRFERNRIIGYTIHKIHMDPAGNRAHIKVTFYSDDTLPFGKVLPALHEWIKGPEGWYPGKIVAPQATWWDKLR